MSFDQLQALAMKSDRILTEMSAWQAVVSHAEDPEERAHAEGEIERLRQELARVLAQGEGPLSQERKKLERAQAELARAKVARKKEAARATLARYYANKVRVAEVEEKKRAAGVGE